MISEMPLISQLLLKTLLRIGRHLSMIVPLLLQFILNLSKPVNLTKQWRLIGNDYKVLFESALTQYKLLTGEIVCYFMAT